MKKRNYHLNPVATSACTNRIMEAAKQLGQKGAKGDMKVCFIFDIWFESKSSDEAAIDVGADMVSMV